MWLAIAIISAVMTFTVQTKNTVEGSGEIPDRVKADYRCTYQKGSVRQGDTAALWLSGMERTVIESVRLYMRSNKNSGAGRITITADGQALYEQTGSYKDWFGTFDNTTYRPMGWSGTARLQKGTIAVTVTGDENSLYIEKYEITYRPTPACTVTLMSSGEQVAVLTEERGGAGVLLPQADSREDYLFEAWSETEFWTYNSEDAPVLYRSLSRYYPKDDVTLYAVYRHKESATLYAAELEDGDYRYVNSVSRTVMAGVSQNGKMSVADIRDDSAETVYHITFSPDKKTAVIAAAWNGTPVGYSGARLVDSPSEWQVLHEGEETLFYYTDTDQKTYALWQPLVGEGDEEEHTGLFLGNVAAGTPMRLQTATERGTDDYTCHPEAQGIDSVQRDDGKGSLYKVHFGAYELIVKDRKKTLRKQ